MKSRLKQASAETIQRLANGGTRLKGASIYLIEAFDRNHEKIADHADSIEKSLKVAAGLTVAGAIVAAQTGLTAVGVAVGLVSAPIIVTAAPLITSATIEAFIELFKHQFPYVVYFKFHHCDSGHSAHKHSPYLLG